MAKIRTGDQVVVLSGEDKGRQGRVSRVLKDRAQVVVEGVNTVKRHVKATPQRPGGILEVEAPISVGKVAVVDPSTGKPARVKFKIDNGKKTRVTKTGSEIPSEQR